MMLGSRFIHLLSIAMLTAVSAPAALATGSGQSAAASAGFYTDAQASHGRQVFKENCAACHSADLKGKGKAPALVGEPFTDMWAGERVGRLFTKITGTMPRADPGSLADDEYIDVLAYIMQANAFPAGTTDLKEDALAAIQIPLPAGTAPKPLRNFKLVAVDGCLSHTDGGWLLTRGTEPTVTQDDATVAPAATSGTGTYRLSSMNAFKGAARHGQHVQLKGLLYRGDSSDSRLDVTFFHALSAACAP
jgi:mono/diheme cytochrome c family protein